MNAFVSFIVNFREFLAFTVEMRKPLRVTDCIWLFCPQRWLYLLDAIGLKWLEWGSINECASQCR